MSLYKWIPEKCKLFVYNCFRGVTVACQENVFVGVVVFFVANIWLLNSENFLSC